MSLGRRKRPGDGRSDGPSPPKLTTRNKKSRCLQLLSAASVLLFDPSSLHVADAQQACEIFLTPTRVMTGELAEGARLTSYTNLRVGCKMFYRKEAATQVSTAGAATAPQVSADPGFGLSLLEIDRKSTSHCLFPLCYRLGAYRLWAFDFAFRGRDSMIDSSPLPA